MSSSLLVRRAVRALTLAIVLGASAGAQAASAVTVRVDDDKAQCPHARFRQISPALAAVPPGSTIVVCPGTYVETLRITKSGVRVIGLRGRHSDIVVTQGPGADPSIPMVEMSAPDTRLGAVRIRDTRPTPGTGCFSVGVLVDNGPGPFAGASVIDNVTVRQLAPELPFECVFKGTGIGVGAASRPGRGIVRNSTVVAGETGVAVTGDASEAAIGGNVITVQPGHVDNGEGVFIQGGATARVVRNDVSRFNLGVWVLNGDAVVSGNAVHDNRVGVTLSSGTPPGSTVVNNHVHGNEHGMFVSGQGSVVAGNRIHDNDGFGIQVDVPASGNEFVANVATANILEACSDSTTGGGTAGTANIWVDNIGSPAFPPQICRPPGPGNPVPSAPAPSAPAAR